MKNAPTQNNERSQLLNANFVAWRVMSARKEAQRKHIVSVLNSRPRERTIVRH